MTESEVLEWAKKTNHLEPFDKIDKAGEIEDGVLYLFSYKDKAGIKVKDLRFVLVKDGCEPKIFEGIHDLEKIYQMSHKVMEQYKERGA